MESIYKQDKEHLHMLMLPLLNSSHAHVEIIKYSRLALDMYMLLLS